MIPIPVWAMSAIAARTASDRSSARIAAMGREITRRITGRGWWHRQPGGAAPPWPQDVRGPVLAGILSDSRGEAVRHDLGRTTRVRRAPSCGTGRGDPSHMTVARGCGRNPAIGVGLTPVVRESGQHATRSALADHGPRRPATGSRARASGRSRRPRASGSRPRSSPSPRRHRRRPSPPPPSPPRDPCTSGGS